MKKNFKQTLSLLMSLVMIISMFTGLEISSFAEDDIFRYLEYRIFDGKAVIVYCNRRIIGDVVLPHTIEGYPLEAIYDAAFQACTGLTSIIIPDSVTSIGGTSFLGCTGLTSITIPDSVTIIGAGAFEGCTGLTSITIPDSVTLINAYTFKECTGLANITISDSITSIGSEAFYNTAYYNSESNWENNVLYIGNYLIAAKPDITGCTLRNGTSVIAGSAFLGCTRLTSITIPDSVTIIDSYAFKGCTGLTNITISDSVTIIGGYTFEGCTGLTSITIPDSVTIIGCGAFFGCSGLANITIPDSVVLIDEEAFYGCSGLTSITIPDSITEINDGVFAYCTGLTDVTIPDTVTGIGLVAFEGCTSLTNIIIPDSVTMIGEAAFSGCMGLKSITIPSSVTYIEEFAFGIYNTFDLDYSDYKFIDGFTIYGYTGSEAEAYANRYDINFVSIGVIEKEDLEINDASIIVDTDKTIVTIVAGKTADEISEMIENDDFIIVDKNGDELSRNAIVGTGAKIQLKNSDGFVTEYTVIVPTDIDGNGKTTAADARLALRASAKLEKVEGVYAIASDIDGNDKITAADARKILRISAGLEKA